jgi:hypothetical protein
VHSVVIYVCLVRSFGGPRIPVPLVLARSLHDGALLPQIFKLRATKAPTLTAAANSRWAFALDPPPLP